MAKKSYKKDGMCKTFFKLFKSPTQAFRDINLEEGIGTALLLLIISAILGRLLVFLIGIFSYRTMLPLYFQEYEYLNTFILAGMQIIGIVYGGTLKSTTEIGFYKECFRDFLGLTGEQEVFHLHNYYVEFELLDEFEIFSKGIIAQAVKHREKPVYGVLFHPEVRQRELITNFCNL